MGQCNIRHPHIADIIPAKYLRKKEDHQHIQSDDRPVSTAPETKLLLVNSVPDVAKAESLHQQSDQIRSVI